MPRGVDWSDYGEHHGVVTPDRDIMTTQAQKQYDACKSMMVSGSVVESHECASRYPAMVWNGLIFLVAFSLLMGLIGTWAESASPGTFLGVMKDAGEKAVYVFAGVSLFVALIMSATAFFKALDGE
jgi:hypothetical protein